eukprot:sb/3461795/
MTLLLLVVLPALLNANTIGLLTESGETVNTIYQNLLQLLPDDTSPPNPPVVTTTTNPSTAAGVHWLTFNSSSTRNKSRVACEMLQSNVTVVVLKGRSDDTQFFAGFFSDYNIPLIAVSATSSQLRRENKGKTLVTMSPSDLYQSAAIIELLQYYNWREVSILASDDGYGINAVVHLQMLLLQQPDLKVRNVLVFDTCNNDNLKVVNQLKTFKASLDRVIIYFGSASYARNILSEAHSMGLLGSEFVWIMSDAVSANVRSLSFNGLYKRYYGGLIGIRPRFTRSAAYDELSERYAEIGSPDDLTDYTLLTYDGLMLARAVVSSLDLPDQNLTCANPSTCSGGTLTWDQGGNNTSSSTWQGGERVLSVIKSVEYEGITGRITFQENGEVGTAAYDIVNFIGNTFVRVGGWSSGEGLEMAAPVTFFNNTITPPTGRANTLTGIHLRLGMMPEVPFISEPDPTCLDKTSPLCYTGINIEIVEMMGSKLGFTYHFVQPEDMKYGRKNDTTGEWNGLIRDLLDNKTDMIIVALSNNLARKHDIDFTYPIFDAGLAAFVKSDSEERDVFFFLRPFERSIWIAVLLGCVLVTLVTYFLSQASPFGLTGSLKFCQNSCPCKSCRTGTSRHSCKVLELRESDQNKGLDVKESFWMVSSGLVGHKGGVTPRSVSGRILLFFWRFFILLLCTMYTANMAAFLTISHQATDLTSPLQLLTQSAYKWGVVDSTNPQILLESNIKQEYRTLGHQAMKLNSSGAAMDLLREGGFVYISEVPTMDFLTLGECNIVRVGDSFQPFDLAFGVRKNSPYKNLVDTFLLENREKGVLDALYQRYEKSKQTKSCAPNHDLTMYLSNLSGIFYLIPMGIASSLICLILEYIYTCARDSATNFKILDVLSERFTFQFSRGKVVGQRRVNVEESDKVPSATMIPLSYNIP